MIWGWLVTSVLSFTTVMCISEMSSMYPYAGSVYHFTALMTPSESLGRILSLLCGWSNIVGTFTYDATLAFVVTQIMTATMNLMLELPIEIPTKYMVLISVAIHLLWALKNKMNIKNQGLFAIIAALFTIVTSLIIAICLVMLPTGISTTEFVFSSYNNETGFDDSYFNYVNMIGLLFSQYCLS
jgi:amino acid transporter